jgi:hypothetical protein
VPPRGRGPGTPSLLSDAHTPLSLTHRHLIAAHGQLLHDRPHDEEVGPGGDERDGQDADGRGGGRGRRSQEEAGEQGRGGQGAAAGGHG